MSSSGCRERVQFRIPEIPPLSQQITASRLVCCEVQIFRLIDDGGGVMTAGRISRLRASDVDEMSIIMRKKNARAREAIELGCVHGQEAADAFDRRFLRRRRGAPSGV